MLATISILATFIASGLAARAQVFAPPSTSPTTQSGNYTGSSNGTLINSPYVKGAAFDRFIIIVLENTDFSVAASSLTFQKLMKQGILFDGYYGVSHPSEPNYLAMTSGEFHGLNGDQFLALPKNVSTIVDLLDAKDISWAAYQENLPFDGFGEDSFTSHNYINSSLPDYTYYERKHNPLIIHNSVASIPERALRVRNFNDLAVDIQADTMPQWSFITPNMVNDAHNTDIDSTSKWLEYFLVPLLENPNFNSEETLVILTFDENEDYSVNNQIFTLALGGSLPEELIGTTDSTYYSHYSSLSTVEANWGLGSLGRGDTSKIMSNVYSWVAEATKYVNNDLLGSSPDIPLSNRTGDIPGPLNSGYFVNVISPNTTAVGAGGGPVFVYPGTNTSFTAATAPAPVDLKKEGKVSPYIITASPYDYSRPITKDPSLLQILHNLTRLMSNPTSSRKEM